MKRTKPATQYEELPCLITAVSCVLGDMPCDMPELKPNGYATLSSANKWIRKHLDVKKRVDYKRGNRPLLAELSETKAIVCVLGHYVYVNNDVYYSFFNNLHDEVVTMWILK